MEINKTWLWAGATSVLAGVAFLAGRGSGSSPREEKPPGKPRPTQPTLVAADAVGHLYTIGYPPFLVFVDGAFVAALRERAIAYGISPHLNAIHLRFRDSPTTDLTLIVSDATAPEQLGRLFRPSNQDDMERLLEVGQAIVRAGQGQQVPLRAINE